MLANSLAVLFLALTPPQTTPDDDPRVAWLAKHAVSMRSIDPKDDDFSDIEPLRAIIGDARIVQLGEQSHGDGASFHAKTRLIKFLHQKMEFDVLAWESGLFDCRKAWESFRRRSDPMEAAQLGIFGIWTQSEQVRPIVDYLAAQAKTDRPLELCGFDCQFTAGGSRDSLLSDLDAFVRKVNPPIVDAETWQTLGQTVTRLMDYQYKPTGAERERGRKALAELREALNRPDLLMSHEAAEVAFWRQMAESLLGQADQHWQSQNQPAAGAEAVNGRDEQMARNLIWLANERYPKRKIIVWAATFHLMRNPATIDTAASGVSYEKTLPMGHHLSESLGKQVFTVGFTSYEGTAGVPWQSPRDIGKAVKDSFEDLCVRAGLQNAVINFRNTDGDAAWLREKISSRPLGHMSMRADWTQVLDGIVFIRKMTPSSRGSPQLPRVSDAEKAKAKDLIANIDQHWQQIQRMAASRNPFVDKNDFALAYEQWKQATSPDADATTAMENSVEEWFAERKDENGLEWRVQSLLADMAAGRKDVDAALARLDRALAAYPDKTFTNPAVHSKFQHLVNARAMLVWDQQGDAAAVEFVTDLMATDRRFQFFFPFPWTQRYIQAGTLESVFPLVSRIKAAYRKRAEAFPEFAAQIEQFNADLDEVATEAIGLHNLNLEQGETGKAPVGWFVPPAIAPSHNVTLTEENARAGKRSAVISSVGKPKPDTFGNLMQSIDAAPYRGKRVRLRAAVRTEVAGAGNQAQLWFRVDRPGNQMGFFDNMQDRPITSKDWADYEIAGEIAADAASINFGLLLLGAGKAWLDSVSLEIVKAPDSEQDERLKKLATPGEYHQRFDALAGKWQLAVRWRATPDVKWTDSTGTAEYKWILGGRFLHEQFKYDMGHEPLEWLGIYGYDNFQKKFTAVWVDNMGTNTEFADGQYDPAGKVFTYIGEQDDPATGGKRKFKWIITIETPDRVRFDSYDQDPPGTYFKNTEVVGTRLRESK